MKQVDPKAVWLFFIQFVFVGIIPIFILSGWASMPFLAIASSLNIKISLAFVLISLFLLFCLFFVFCFLWAKLTYHFYRYELTEDGFRKELGVIWKTYVTIPYDRIQNVDIYRGIWDRILGLSTLNIQTAGASGRVTSEGRLPGLRHTVAEELRDEVIRRARHNRNQGL
ncbi:MAG: PH domain-containing protein [Candidatus Paceibacterota bacterium]